MKAVDEKLKMIERLMVVIPVMVSVLFCWDAKLNLKVRCFVHECSLIYLIWSSGFGGGFITICISCLRYSFGAYLSRFSLIKSGVWHPSTFEHLCSIHFAIFQLSYYALSCTFHMESIIYFVLGDLFLPWFYYLDWGFNFS